MNASMEIIFNHDTYAVLNLANHSLAEY